MADDLISRVLIRERRAALAEFGALAAVFGLIGAILTALSYLFLAAAVVYFLRGRAGSGDNFPSPLGLSGKLAIAAMTFFAIGTREELFGPTMVRKRRYSLRTNLEPLSELFVGLIMAGPRCLVIAFQSVLQAWKIFQLDVDRLWAPIDIALQYRRKIRQSDLGHIDIEEFIKNVEWLKGVVPLYAPPIGFVLTAEFRAELGDSKAFEEANKPNERLQLPGEPAPMTERQWALITLELHGSPTPREIKQAYRRLAKIHHPDVRKNPEAEPRMKNLNRAKEILGSN